MEKDQCKRVLAVQPASAVCFALPLSILMHKRQSWRKIPPAVPVKVMENHLFVPAMTVWTASSSPICCAAHPFCEWRENRVPGCSAVPSAQPPKWWDFKAELPTHPETALPGGECVVWFPIKRKVLSGPTPDSRLESALRKTPIASQTGPSGGTGDQTSLPIE